MSDVNDDLHRPRAARFAAALTAAAAADERVTVLEKQLEDSEFFRSIAEEVAAGIREYPAIGKVYGPGTEAPPEDVKAIIDWSMGRVWVRAQNWNGTDSPDEWLRADQSQHGQTRYAWPFEGGPFIAFPEDFGFWSTLNLARKMAEELDEFHRLAQAHHGYRDSAWGRPSPGAALERIVKGYFARVVEANEKVTDLAHRLDRAQQELAELKIAVQEREIDKGWEALGVTE